MSSPTKDDVEPVVPGGAAAAVATEPRRGETRGTSVQPTNSGLSWLTRLVTSAVDAYSAELRESPIRTKAITSCAIAMLAEVIGTQLKPRRADGSRGIIHN